MPESPGPPRARLALTWILGSLPLALGWLADSGQDRLAGVSLLALCAIPWVFLCGMPRGIGARAPFAHEIAGLALGLPTLAAAAALDLAQGAGWFRTLALAAIAILSILVLGDAARRAASSARAALIHAIAWFALVAAPVLLLHALEIGGGPFLGNAPLALRLLASTSPLGLLAIHEPRITGSLDVWPVSLFGAAAVLGVVAGSAALGARAKEPA